MAILILENDPMIATILAEVVTDQGWAVLTADRLADARAHLASGVVTVVIADKYLLPGEDGHDFASRSRDVWPNLAIIYMTGGPGSRPEHLLRDHEWALSKPFDLNQVIETLRLIQTL